MNHEDQAIQAGIQAQQESVDAAAKARRDAQDQAAFRNSQLLSLEKHNRELIERFLVWAVRHHLRFDYDKLFRKGWIIGSMSYQVGSWHGESVSASQTIYVTPKGKLFFPGSAELKAGSIKTASIIEAIARHSYQSGIAWP